MNDYSQSMKRVFADLIHKKMAKNDRIWVVTGDLGYKMWDQIIDDYPDRYINVGAAEQSMMGIGIGLALAKKIPLVYSITPFLLFRPFETIRNYINYEKIPVKLIASGRDKDYANEGYSHWGEEDKDVMKIFTRIKTRWPDKVSELAKIVDEMINSNKPWYINLKKTS